MPYRYVASTKAGEVVKGVSDLASAKSVQQALEAKGLVVVSVKPMRRQKLAQSGLSAFGFVTHVEKVIFTKHLTVMVKAGLSLLDALRILREQASSSKFRSVLGQVVKSVESGQSLSDSLARHPRVFSPFFVNVIRAGESAGTLEGNLEHLAEQFTKDHELRQKVRNALMYPAFVLVAAVIIAFFFALYVIPQITSLFSGLKDLELPLVTQLMVSFANFAKNNSALLVGGTIGGVMFLIWLMRLKVMRPISHGIVLRLPIVGKLTKDVNLALFSLVLGTQLKSGIPIMQALEVAGRVIDNYYFQRAILAATETVSRGGSLSEGLADFPEIFSSLTVRMVEVGERSGRLEDVLGFLSEFYSLEVETMMKNLTTVLEPVMLVVIGLLALALAYAIIIPIYNYVSVIGNMGR
jgi:type II secretory pathway component PulF